MADDFIGYLVNLIRKQAGQFISSESDDLRVVFSAVPGNMLDEVFDRFEEMGPRVNIERDGHVKSVPVLRIQNGVDDPPHQNSTRCSGSHVVTLRNNYGSYLALAAINDPPLLSTGTTVNKLGLDKVNHVGFSTWRDETFVQEVFDAVLGQFDGVGESERALVWQALEEAFGEASQASDLEQPWDLFRVLYDAGGAEKSRQDLCHSLGLPMQKDGDEPDSKLNQAIASFFQEHGFNAGTDLLLNDAGTQDVKDALNLFKKDAITLYRTPQEYAVRPLGNYAKARRESGGGWWQELSQAIWLELLNQGEEQKTGTLKVSCANEVFRRTLNGQMAVVQSIPEFQLEVDDNLLGHEVIVSRAAARKRLQQVGKVKVSEQKVYWTDKSIPDLHEQCVRYEFRSEKLEKPVSFKLVSLEAYLPSVVLNCRSAQKLGPFKKKVGRGASATTRYECELITNGTGTHTVEFFHSDEVDLPPSLEVTIGDGDTQDSTKWSVTQPDGRKGYGVAVIEVTETCHFDFELDTPDQEGTTFYRVFVSPNEFTSKGASSEFDKLVTNNCASSVSTTKVDVRSTMLTILESWIMEEEDSYQPLVLGPGFKDIWHPPTWNDLPRLTTHSLTVDPRPRPNELSAPEGYVSARNKVREFVKGYCEDKGCSIEALSFGQLMQAPEKRKLIEDYVCEYMNWLSMPGSLAAWADVVTVHRPQSKGNHLESIPLAVLLTPLHPVRLAWQCNAQQLLHEAFQEGCPCPVAGVMEPSNFPDCLVLSCRDIEGKFGAEGFAAVKSSSDYWSVLWRASLISEVSDGNNMGVFGHELGLRLEGMVNGFNKQQVKRSLDEIRQLLPAKTRLKVSLHSDSSGYSSCNDGIDEWCLENLGPEVDEWSPAGGLTLQVIDKRPPSEQPEPAVLASLTERSGTRVRWYTKGDKSSQLHRDLSIVDHLETMDQKFRKDEILSPVDPSCVSRLSIKKNASDHRHYLSMSRAGQFVQKGSGNLLQDKLSEVLAQLESTFVNETRFDSLGFAPNLEILDASLNNTRYSAISSSAVDASCFHQPDKDSFLWDFELPRYAPGVGPSSGFYLVAKQSPTMITAMKSVLENILGAKNTSEEQVVALLEEVSRRGIPTLKRLTSGGSASLGEVGMLVASRLLQADFREKGKAKGLVPAIDNQMVNLVIPADVFQPRFDELRKALRAESRERPDLLVMSINFDIDAGGKLVEPRRLKITPIEVKARSGVMNGKQRDDAIGQATCFAKFLAILKEQGEKAPLWGIAYRDLLASWLDYGFRVYGETSVAQSDKSWVHYHQQTLAKLMSSDLTVEIDHDGRLVTVEETGKKEVSCTGKQDNIAILGYELAVELLTGNQSRVVEDMISKVGDWNLLATGETTGAKGEKTNIENHQVTQAPTVDHGAMNKATGSGELLPNVRDDNSSEGMQAVPEDKISAAGGSSESADDVRTTSVRNPIAGLKRLSDDELESRYESIINTLREFKIFVCKPNTVAHFTEGPASIMYRVQPAPGIPPQKIIGQEDTLKLVLGLSEEQSIRTFIHEGCVVIDVPKRQSERYFIDAEQLWQPWERPASALAAPLGIDQFKGIVEFNFSSSNSPHLLIGGTTGSGKSEALNTILFGLTRYYSDCELRLLLVDPKGTEMAPFEHSPHLEGEIGWDDDSAIEQLELAVEEMQRRYDLFKQAKKRSLTDYNSVAEEKEKLPWWVIVLDEYADLTADPEKKKQIEALLQRLAQKARAAGIHVIIATQKPSVNVISTVLRSNLPAQLALRVKSATESRVIMDETGAEALNGKGDAFLKSEGKLTRLQCAMYKGALS